MVQQIWLVSGQWKCWSFMYSVFSSSFFFFQGNARHVDLGKLDPGRTFLIKVSSGKWDLIWEKQCEQCGRCFKVVLPCRLTSTWLTLSNIPLLHSFVPTAHPAGFHWLLFSTSILCVSVCLLFCLPTPSPSFCISLSQSFFLPTHHSFGLSLTCSLSPSLPPPPPLSLSFSLLPPSLSLSLSLTLSLSLSSLFIKALSAHVTSWLCLTRHNLMYSFHFSFLTDSFLLQYRNNFCLRSKRSPIHKAPVPAFFPSAGLRSFQGSAHRDRGAVSSSSPDQSGDIWWSGDHCAE